MIPQRNKRQPGRHSKLAGLARRLIAVKTNDPAVQELQAIAEQIMTSKFGNPALTNAQEKGQRTSAGAAEAHSYLVEPHIEKARAAGVTTLDDLADYLNGAQVFTRWGHAWSKGSLRPFLKRIDARKTQDAELS